jgi:TolB-like protein
MSFFSELKRRQVVQVGVGYLLVAWGVAQVAELILDSFETPAWIIQVILIGLAVGFPIAITLSWVFDLRWDGLHRERPLEEGNSDSKASTQKTNHQSIAVLPFVDMSADGDQEYMSDGIAEELLNLLAKIPNLRVISRSSSFSFKGKDIEVSEIAQRLAVAHILEGSVRKSGNQLRITAQLIDARTDTHLWSETYDRELQNIFAIQDEIAGVVVQQLKVKILGDLPSSRETNPDAYALYLQARHLEERMSADSLKGAIALYEEALNIDPDFLPAWLELAGVYYNQAFLLVGPDEELYVRANAALQEVFRISPESTEAFYQRARFKVLIRHDLVGAVRDLERGLALEAVDSVPSIQMEFFLQSLGRLDEATRLLEYYRVRDPVNIGIYNNLGVFYRWLGRFQLARERFSTLLTLSPEIVGVHYELGIIELQNRNFDAAMRQFEEETTKVFRLVGSAMAYHAKGQSELSDESLHELISNHGDSAAYYIAIVMAFRNEPNKAFDWLEKSVAGGEAGEDIDCGYESLFANLHSDPRWPVFLESIGRSPAQLAALDFEIRLPG